MNHKIKIKEADFALHVFLFIEIFFYLLLVYNKERIHGQYFT